MLNGRVADLVLEETDSMDLRLVERILDLRITARSIAPETLIKREFVQVIATGAVAPMKSSGFSTGIMR